MITNGFKWKNVPLEYLKLRKEAKKSNTTVHEPDDLNWAYVFNNEKLRTINNMCKTQHLKYVAHATRLGNFS